MAKLWGRLIKNHKIMRDFVLPYDLNYDDPDSEWLYAVIKGLGIPRPMVLSAHAADWAQFRQMRFLPDDFVEEVDFDRFEVEVMREGGRSRDPRNEV